MEKQLELNLGDAVAATATLAFDGGSDDMLSDSVLRANIEHLKSQFDFFQDEVEAFGKDYQGTKTVLSGLEEKVMAQYRLTRSLIMYMRDMDTKIDAVAELLIENKIITQAAFEDKWDKNRGLQLLPAGSVIQSGDIAWIDFTAVADDGTKQEQKNFPLRLGSGNFVFETALVGQKAGTTNVTFTHKYEKDAGGDFAGKKVDFVIDILRAKRSVDESSTEVTQ